MSALMTRTIRSLLLTEALPAERDLAGPQLLAPGPDEPLHDSVGEQPPAERQRGLRERDVQVERRHHGAVLDRKADDLERVVDDEHDEEQVEQVEVGIQDQAPLGPERAGQNV